MPTKTNSPITKMSKSQMWDAGIGVASVGLGLLGVPPSITSMAGQAIKGQAYDPANEEGYVDPNAMKNTQNQYAENLELQNPPPPFAYSSKKALTQMQGTVAHNMSAKQYESDKKMNALAMHGIPSSLTMIENPSVNQIAAFDHNNDNKVSTEELKTTFKS